MRIWRLVICGPLGAQVRPGAARLPSNCRQIESLSLDDVMYCPVDGSRSAVDATFGGGGCAVPARVVLGFRTAREGGSGAGLV
jgi:hypothetical protein